MLGSLLYHSNKKQILVHAPFLALIVVFVLIGFLSYTDYGISWDEQLQRGIGAKNILIANHHTGYKLMSKDSVRALAERQIKYHGYTSTPEQWMSIDYLQSFNDRHYGPSIEILLLVVEKVLDLRHSEHIYKSRHLILHLLFILSVIIFYLLLIRQFNSPVLGFLGVLMLLLSPRIYAHSFYNSKDLAFMVFVIITTYTMWRCLEKPSATRIFIHALLSAFTIDIRIVGILIPLITIIGMVFFYWRMINTNSLLIYFKKILLYLVLTWLWAVVFWPWTWDKPFTGWFDVIQTMSNYPWGGHIVYRGQIIRSIDGLPWHYIPTWIGITTPWIVLSLLPVFIILLIIRFRSIPWNLKLFIALSSAMILTPVLASIYKESVLYNGWRHFYFVYPFIVILSISGLYLLKQHYPNLRNVLVIATLVMTISVVGSMAYLHPYQGIYFNSLAGSSPWNSYDWDYWGISYKEGLEYILTNNTDNIYIYPAEAVGFYASYIFSQRDQSRLIFTNQIDQADFFLTNYTTRGETRLNHLIYWKIEDWPEVYFVERNGGKLLSVFKNPKK